MDKDPLSAAYLAVAAVYLDPFVDHAAAPCQDTFGLHWGACGAAGVGGVWQLMGFGEFFVHGS